MRTSPCPAVTVSLPNTVDPVLADVVCVVCVALAAAAAAAAAIPSAMLRCRSSLCPEAQEPANPKRVAEEADVVVEDVGSDMHGICGSTHAVWWFWKSELGDAR